MDQALTAFLITVAIVGGILSPFLLLAFLYLTNHTMRAIAQLLINKGEELKKQPPFDEVETTINPLAKKMTARFVKNNVVIWQGDVEEALEEQKGPRKLSTFIPGGSEDAGR